MAYKPEGYTSVAPYLIVPDATLLLDFVARVFSSEPVLVVRSEHGGIRHAEFRIDDTIVMCGEASGAPASNVHVYVDDVDAAFARALEAGGTEVEPLREKGDGDRRGGIADPSGTVWWLSTQITPRR
jgi:uncharacterized glyoxalase superfamily protein PhnB